MADGLKLNIGAGKTELPGFVPVDLKNGNAGYPLAYADGSVAEIYASHVLEHWSHQETAAVLADWFRVLAPGGRLRVAVPDFEKIARAFVERDPEAPVEGWLMGGQTDANDFHRAVFTPEKLTALLTAAGFVDVKPWTAEIRDCASLPVSLNLQGTKPGTAAVAPPRTTESPILADPTAGPAVPAPLGRVIGVWSCPRLGFMDAFDSIYRSLGAAGIKMYRGMGVFWGQQIELLMDSAIADDKADLLLCLDYDAVFTPDDLSNMLRLMATHPEVDALCSHQWNRAADRPLWTVEGNRRVEAPELLAAGELFPIATGHFGLTLLRTKALARVPKPWFQAIPAPDGTWGPGKVDSDIRFWMEFARAGCLAYLAPRVVIGHLELALRWPGRDCHLTWQHMYDYHAKGKPENTFGG